MMSYGEQQKKEIKTITERTITVKLSDADCDRLAKKCGEHGLTIGELIENFVGDLVSGTYSNGSDERDYADQWFERCWFGMFPEKTLLNHLLLNWEDGPEHYLFAMHEIETAKENIRSTEKEIAEPSDIWKHIFSDSAFTKPCYLSVDEYMAALKEDLQSYHDDLREWTEELESMREDWEPETEPNMGEEIERIKKWVEEKEELLLKNENRRPQTMEQFHIKQWIDDTFVKGCLRVEYTGNNTAKIMDNKGDIICVEYKDGEVRECQGIEEQKVVSVPNCGTEGRGKYE